MKKFIYNNNMLIKANPKHIKNKDILHPLLRYCNNMTILDYNMNPRNDNIIPIYHNKTIIFVNINSFIQNNNIIGKYVRKKVYDIISDSTNILAIGGESYMYIINKKGKFLTNNKFILDDFKYNKKIYNSNVDGNIVDYNNFITSNNKYDCCIINLSKLNKSLMEGINKMKINKIIIISCHHNDFWKKIKNLSNYKIIIRKKYIDDKSRYFLTVNLLIKKY